MRAERVVAHGPAPRGFLVHGGDAMLWTAYVNGGSVPRGPQFIHGNCHVLLIYFVDYVSSRTARNGMMRAGMTANSPSEASV